MFDEENEETPQEEVEVPAEETPSPDSEEAPAAEPEEAPAAEPEEAPAAEPEEAPAAEEPPKRERKKDEKEDEPEVIPGADLEPDLVLEDSAKDREGLGEGTAAVIEAADESLSTEGGDGQEAEEAPAVTSVLELAADARYQATGKRKRAIARVTLKPGTGEYSVNGRGLEEFFPRPTLQRIARGPLETAGHQERMDVVAKIHGGGVSSQAGALRHGITKALVEADPTLRGELKRRGYLTRDARVKERKKAGLKKARKRPQFSKR